jgi:hypothetical protein
MEGVIFCDGCGAEITWTPIIIKTIYHTYEYCCEDCADERSCACGDRMILGDEQRAHRPQDFSSYYPN